MMASCTMLRQLTCLLLVLAPLSAAMNITGSNESTAIANWTGAIEIQTPRQNPTNLSSLVPLSNKAASLADNDPIEGLLTYTNAASLDDRGNQNSANASILYLSCNPDDYPGFTTADDVFQGMYAAGPMALVLYSTATDYCRVDNLSPTLQAWPIFSMTRKSDSAQMLSNIQSPSVSTGFAVDIQSWGNGNDASRSQDNGQNPLGPSPSTAVAMIILYSITGIITALFLVIIITGAVRAHRHPDRYGPRDVLGRPRQSRARGLGRAILDTLPIVKFGEREPAKPTDVELGSTAEARTVDGVEAEGTVTDQNNKDTTAETTPTQQADAVKAPATEQQSGIAAALPAAATVTPTPESDSPDEGLGCSICTEDFEKGQDLRVLPCNHKFHPDCVDPWLLNVSGTCPLCRVDLRPTTSHSTLSQNDPDSLAPPLPSETDTNRLRFRDLLQMRNRPGATAEERLGALRRFREQRRNASREGVAPQASEAGQEDAVEARRSRRISARVMGAFGRGRDAPADNAPESSPEASGAAGSSSQQPAGRS